MPGRGHVRVCHAAASTSWDLSCAAMTAASCSLRAIAILMVVRSCECMTVARLGQFGAVSEGKKDLKKIAQLVR